MTKKNKILLISGSVILAMVIVAVIIFSASLKKKEKTFTVNFETNGGSLINSQKVTEGNLVIKPSDPIKEGYTFFTWKYNGQSFDFKTKITKDITLRAEWIQKSEDEKKEEFTIKFESDGTKVNDQLVMKDGKVEKPSDPEKGGYAFVSWQLDGVDYDFTLEVTKDITLVATWKKVETVGGEVKTKYTVTFNANGGSSVASQKIESGKKATKPSNPTKSGYTFKEWQLNGKTYNFSSVITKNITLTAKWEEKKQEPVVTKYTVTFDANGGSSVSNQTVVSGEKVSQPTNPTKNGYIFKEWQLNGKTYNFGSVVTSDITLTAKWEEREKVTVTFNSNGGSSVASRTIFKGDKLGTLPSNPTKSGYTFDGWYNGSTKYTETSVIDSSITLTAKWTQKNYTITVTKVDEYSPDRRLIVKENGEVIMVRAIKYTDGTELCIGSNLTVSASDITGETSLIVVLNDGTQVNAIVN